MLLIHFSFNMMKKVIEYILYSLHQNNQTFKVFVTIIHNMYLLPKEYINLTTIVSIFSPCNDTHSIRSNESYQRIEAIPVRYIVNIHMHSIKWISGMLLVKK